MAGADRRDNNFDVLRLVAALLVLTSHAWALAGRSEPSFAGDSLGGLGVTVFFAISGFLIAQSWTADPRAGAFLTKRALRLWPALLVVLAASALVLGPLVSTTSAAHYYAQRETFEYFASNAQLHTTYNLPGVFANNPISAVNGSLWTLPVEMKAYLLVLVLGLAGCLRRPLVVGTLFALLVWFYALPLDSQPPTVADWFVNPFGTAFTITFVGGALLFALRRHVRLDWRFALLALAAAALTAEQAPALRAAVWGLAIPYLLVYLAMRSPRRLRALVKPGDVSYGVYVWAYPVEQTVVHVLGPRPAPLLVLAVSALLTYALAVASWRLVEAPALRLKRHVAARAEPQAAPAVA